MTAQHEQEMSDAHQEIRAQLSQLQTAHVELEKALAHHAGEGHASLMSSHSIRQLVQQVQDGVKANSVASDLLLDALVGSRHPLTGDRQEQDGVLWKVDEMWHAAMNGGRGMKARLSIWERVLIAAIAGGSSVVAAWLGQGI